MTSFKIGYSEYRKNVANAYSYGNREDFRAALRSNDLFFEVSCKGVKPVSMKIFIYKNYREIYNSSYKSK